MQWDLEGLHWPHRQTSRFVTAAGLRWHVQQFEGPSKLSKPIHATHQPAKPMALLLHGTGASTHSWRGLAPLLAKNFSVVAVDLPGHAFTSMPAGGPSSPRLSLTGMANAVQTLLSTENFKPDLVVGHSAGAAIAARMCLDGGIAPHLLVALNGAFLPLGGLAGQFFSPAAKLLAATPFVPTFFSKRAANPVVLQRLIDGTGSKLDVQGLALYSLLVKNASHAAGALGMMANWNLNALGRDLAQLTTRLSLVVGSNDLTIPPTQASRVLAMLPPESGSFLTSLKGLGHLAHEERPELVADLIIGQFERQAESHITGDMTLTQNH